MLHKLLFTLAIMAGALSVVNGLNDYPSSCRDCQLTQFDSRNAWLGCYCGDAQGNWPYTNINLNHCYANDKGTLVFAVDGNFMGTYGDLKFNAPSSLTATCGNGAGDWRINNINLSNYIGNFKGTLACNIGAA